MDNIYCGNNRLDSRVVDGTLRIPTNPYQCFRKGVGKGLSMPLDQSYGSGYDPIDRTKLWCGSGPMPRNQGYTRRGSNVQCLRKGVGVGKKLKYERSGGVAVVPLPEETGIGLRPLLWLVVVLVGIVAAVWLVSSLFKPRQKNDQVK